MMEQQKPADEKRLLIMLLQTSNPDSALGIVSKLNYSIKTRAHGLFLKKEYFGLSILKIGVSSWF